jgi:apolipoprotein D and lipocalin family protein
MCRRTIGRAGLTAAVLGLGLMATGCGMSNLPLPVVENVDVDRYLGKWYEIARYPNSFEAGCEGVTAEYALREDGRISVVNSCRDVETGEVVQRIEGVARVADPSNSAKLRVQFFWPFEGDYWIIDLDEENYEYAVVGEPGRRFLWILSRSPQMDEALYEELTAKLPDLAYDPDRLIRVEQVAD